MNLPLTLHPKIGIAVYSTERPIFFESQLCQHDRKISQCAETFGNHKKLQNGCKSKKKAKYWKYFVQGKKVRLKLLTLLTKYVQNCFM